MSEIAGTSANIMQRLYDALTPPETPATKTVDKLATELHFSAATIREALRRLRRLRCVTGVCVSGEWRYGRRKGSVRPTDGRWRHAQ